MLAGSRGGMLLFGIGMQGAPALWLVYAASLLLGAALGIAYRFLYNLVAFWIVEGRAAGGMAQAIAFFFTGSLVPVAFFLLRKSGHPLPFAHSVIYSVAFTTIAWLITAFVGSQTSRDTLVAFYRKVHPSGPGWTRIREAAGVSLEEAARHSDHLGKATLGWIAGCLTIWSGLFATGQWGVDGLFWGGDGAKQLGVQLLGSAVCTVVALAAGFALMFGIKRFGMLRVSEEGELEGIDIHEHGGPAYHLEFGTMGYAASGGSDPH